MRKLALSRETIRQLDEQDLRQIQGGEFTVGGACNHTKSCYTLMACPTTKTKDCY